MKVLVTGGDGLVGSHLVDRLFGDSHEVVVLDDFITGKPANLNPHSQNTLIRENLVNPLSDELTAISIERVYNLASPARTITDCTREPTPASP